MFTVNIHLAIPRIVVEPVVTFARVRALGTRAVIHAEHIGAIANTCGARARMVVADPALIASACAL